MSIETIETIPCIVLSEYENDLVGVQLNRPNIPIYIKEKHKIKVTDGVTSAENLPYVIGEFPIGTILTFEGNSAPNDFIELDGTPLSKTSYPELFNIFGIKYGEPTSSEFNLPDTRDLFTNTTIDINYWVKYE